MSNRTTFRTLADLASLLPADQRQVPSNTSAPEAHDGKGKAVSVKIDAKGRKGKTVTLVVGLQHNPQTLEQIAKILKQYCGAGGTVKDGVVEIQGNNRERVVEKLRAMGYVVRS
jgi:translation initiation factor 1